MNHINTKLIPLFEQQGPSFPVEELPSDVRKFAEEVAEAYQVPVDLPAGLILSTIAAVIGKQYKVSIRPDWTESCNIYLAIAMPPGSRKSPVFNAVVEPIEMAEKHDLNTVKEHMIETSKKIEIGEKKIKYLNSKIIKANTPEEEMKFNQEINEVQNNLPEKIKPFRLLADDVTPEKLCSLLSENNGRFSIMSAEGGIFDTVGGRYSSVPNMDVFLKSYSGDMLRVDRQGRESEIVENPTLTMALTVQPEIIKGLSDQPGFRGRGLLGRFMYILPTNLIGFRNINSKAINPGTRMKYHKIVNEVLSALIRKEADADSFTRLLTFSDDAKKIFIDYEHYIENELKPGGDLYCNCDWGGKIAGGTARIIGILHVIKHRNEAAIIKIELSTVRSGILIGKYFIDHAQIAFNLMDQNPLIEKASRVIEFLKEHNGVQISARDIQQPLRGIFPERKLLDPVIKILIDHYYLIPVEIDSNNGPGRKPSPRYFINPELFTHNAQITQNEAVI